MLKLLNNKWLFMVGCILVSIATTANAQNIPPEGLLMKMEPVGTKLAKTFVTTEMLAEYKKQLVQRIIQAHPQYKGQEAKVMQWLEAEFKSDEYFFYLGQQLGQKFTATEIDKIVEFLSTPIGKKLIKESNFMSRESARIAAALVQKKLPSLLQETTQ